MGIEEIYRNFGNEKIITRTKNDLNISFFKSYYWIYTLILILIFRFDNIFGINIASFRGFLIAFYIILEIVFILSQRCKLYYKDNNIILENMLKNKKIINLENYPRIYVKYEETVYHDQHDNLRTAIDYYLNIRQNDKLIKLNMKAIGTSKINILLNSLEYKELEDATEEEINKSASSQQKNYLKMIEHLEKFDRIVGVKDINQKLKIRNTFANYKKIWLISTCVFCIFVLMLIFIIFGNSLSNTRKMIETLAILCTITGGIALFCFIMIIEKGKDKNINISYPSKDTIRINKYLLNYKKNRIMINIVNHKSRVSSELNRYSLIIIGEKNTYSIELDLKDERQLVPFINNLIFEESK